MVSYEGEKVRVYGQMRSSDMKYLDMLIEMYQRRFDPDIKFEIDYKLVELKDKGYNTTRYDIDMAYIMRKREKRLKES